MDNAEHHLGKDTPFYSRLAVAYMQLADAYIVTKEYEKALALVNDAYQIMYSLFGDDDPDSINILSSKSNILYNMGQYQEAYDIGLKNLERYAKFSGELNYLRFEQLITVYKCCLKVGSSEEKERMKNNVLSIAKQLLSKESKQYQELLKLAE